MRSLPMVQDNDAVYIIYWSGYDYLCIYTYLASTLPNIKKHARWWIIKYWIGEHVTYVSSALRNWKRNRTGARRNAQKWRCDQMHQCAIWYICVLVTCRNYSHDIYDHLKKKLARHGTRTGLIMAHYDIWSRESSGSELL